MITVTTTAIANFPVTITAIYITKSIMRNLFLNTTVSMNCKPGVQPQRPPLLRPPPLPPRLQGEGDQNHREKRSGGKRRRTRTKTRTKTVGPALRLRLPTALAFSANNLPTKSIMAMASPIFLTAWSPPKNPSPPYSRRLLKRSQSLSKGRVVLRPALSAT